MSDNQDSVWVLIRFYFGILQIFFTFYFMHSIVCSLLALIVSEPGMTPVTQSQCLKKRVEFSLTALISS